MPISQLLEAMDPPVPGRGHGQAADDLRYRDFLTVALVVPEPTVDFDDNWIYIHDPRYARGRRIQNFGSWSPYMVKEGRNVLGLEYFVFEGDAHVERSADEDLIERARRSSRPSAWSRPAKVEAGYVVRSAQGVPDLRRALPGQRRRPAALARARTRPTCTPSGRNGMFRYNNQDHSMFTAMLTVENITTGASHDVWEVNVEEEYHETLSETSTARSGTKGTGRDAPVLARADVDAVRADRGVDVS